MCKVLIFSGIKKENHKAAVLFAKTMASLMSVANTDGLGYAAVNESGELFGERWLDNKDGFIRPDTEGLYDFLGNAVERKKIDYNRFGIESKMEDGFSAITLHTRMATSSRGMPNTHPFYDSLMDTSLIHNGVINNVKDFKLTLSTCDSESILISYLDFGVNHDATQMTEAASKLDGYYACGVFSKNEDRRILDIFKGRHANLYVSYIKELGTYVFATSNNDIQTACERLKFTFTQPMEIKAGSLLRFDPITGKLTSNTEFKVREYTTYDTHKHWNRYSGYGDDGYLPKNYSSYSDKDDEKGGVIIDATKSLTHKARLLVAKNKLVEKIPSIRELSTTEVAVLLATNVLNRA